MKEKKGINWKIVEIKLFRSCIIFEIVVMFVYGDMIDEISDFLFEYHVKKSICFIEHYHPADIQVIFVFIHHIRHSPWSPYHLFDKGIVRLKKIISKINSNLYNMHSIFRLLDLLIHVHSTNAKCSFQKRISSTSEFLAVVAS